MENAPRYTGQPGEALVNCLFSGGNGSVVFLVAKLTTKTAIPIMINIIPEIFNSFSF